VVRDAFKAEAKREERLAKKRERARKRRAAAAAKAFPDDAQQASAEIQMHKAREFRRKVQGDNPFPVLG
jgi:protein required for attachment to host cells